jgi:uronate dehydrogenase
LVAQFGRKFMQVLLTGSSGRIGRAVAAELICRGHNVRGFDMVRTSGLSDMIVGSLTDRLAIDEAVSECGTVIHLAATPDDDDFVEKILPNNLLGAYNVIESSRLAGVRRLILASSAQVVWHELLLATMPIGAEAPPTPKSWYAASKLFLEGAGRACAEQFNISVLAVRLGWCPRTQSQIDEMNCSDLAKDIYLSPADAGRFFAEATESSDPKGFALVYATSLPSNRLRFDMEAAKRVTGFEPMHRWPEGLDT